MLIGEVARRSGISARTIRFYEAQRLVSRPTRLPSGYRVYPERVLAELRFVRQAQLLGFSLKEVREVSAIGLRGGRMCEKVAALCEEHLREVDRRIVELQEFRQQLETARSQVAGQCGSTADGFCVAIMELSSQHAGALPPTRKRRPRPRVARTARASLA
jgi:DNA-binding transcriptional MerR regulator